MVDNGEVLMVKRGMYKHTLMANNNDWVEICRMVPNGVLCLFSAWHYYSLTTQVSLDYHMAIQHKSKLVLPVPRLSCIIGVMNIIRWVKSK